MKCPCCNKDNFKERYSDVLGKDSKIYSIVECKFYNYEV